MEYVYKRLPLTYSKRLLLFHESYQVEGNAEAVVRDLVLSSHFRKLKSSLGTNKAASKLGKLEQSLHITQDGYAL
jgi:hypothetical protein